jgi:hydrogenase nickel incorporation protein HypB
MNSDRDGSKVEIGAKVMSRNDGFAASNRDCIRVSGIFALNVISSPGAGKTTLLEAMARRYGSSMAVIEGDVRTRRDAERVERAGSRAHQIETGGACHLDAQAVGKAIVALRLGDSEVRLLVIENVGNLICPSGYDLGENIKVGILSVPEGDDKVLKYPSLFSRITVLLINKTDLLPHLDFDVKRAVRECRSLNPDVKVFTVSAKTGEGLDGFFGFLDEAVASVGTRHGSMS